MSEKTKKRSHLSRLGRWAAELLLVFVGVYAAFWLNNYQQRRQEAQRRDQILASLEQQLREGIERAEKSTAPTRNERPQNFGARSKRVR